ncbi:hypothetical protein L3Y34_009417 [Caenorhabditis briggsae]|uniref:Peptidase M13 C-terminal domain-containing protein n=1 Tax=Caenorhabditis briggsae TaxID=6238 RepID=A0AAE9A5P5_CAEBR|nr:hypothetical protein L3Y34_009417 [Caenorhabditis briggsae]
MRKSRVSEKLLVMKWVTDLIRREGNVMKMEKNMIGAPEDSAEYDRKAQCLMDQYNNYDDPDFGRNLNGSTTIKEMAADIIGISVTLKTYNKVDFANEPSIFGFEDEKPDKLFVHLTALGWCRTRDTTPLATQLMAVHPTSSFRVNGDPKFGKYENGAIEIDQENWIVANVGWEMERRGFCFGRPEIGDRRPTATNMHKRVFTQATPIEPLSVDCRSTVDRRLTDGWSAVGRWLVSRSVGRGSVDVWPTVGRRPVDGRSTTGQRDMLSQITRFGGTRLGFFNLILTNEILFIHDPSGITQSIEEVEEVLMDIVKLSGSHPDSKMIQKDIKDLMKLNEELAGIVIRNLPLASLRVFTRNHFNKFNLDMASQLVEDIKESLKQTIQESTWLQEETKKSALLKLKHMKKTIGYPKELEVPGALDVDMSNKDTYFAAILEINRFQTEQTFNNLASLLPMVPDVKLLDSNAFYHMDENHLKLNVAILDDPFLDITYPTYAKIASIGEVIGHEIGHGFDTDGRKRDEKGKKRDWWTPEDSKEYDRRAQCLIDQYNNYDDPDYGRNLNGSMTIDEMAADQIGVELSWKTYNRVDFSLEPSIFGFEDEKPDKLFFHLTALNWCGPRPKRPLSYQQEQVQKRLQKRSTVRLGRR